MEPQNGAGDRVIFLSQLSAGPRQLQVARAAAVGAVLIVATLAPFAPLPLGEVWPFIPIYESALALSDIITAVLLFAQVPILRSRALLILAIGYLFTALLQIPHILSFPGVFSPTGLLGAGPQTTAWLYMVWHGGFPLAVIGYALAKSGGGRRETPLTNPPLAMALSVAGTIVTVIAVTLAVTLGDAWLPPVMNGNTKSVPMLAGFEAVWALSFVPLVVLWRRRPHSILDVWLMVVMCAWLCEGGLSSVFNAGRFDLGFYTGRIFGFLAANFVLLALLLETGALYARLAESFAGEARERELRLAEQERARALAEAATVAKSSFLANMSHEIRTPMNAVIGLADQALRTRLDAKQQDYLVKIKSSAMALLGIINDILDFSKIEAGRLRLDAADFDLRAVLDGVIGVSALRAAEKGLEFVVSVDPALPAMLVGDALRLGQVLQNLVGNAIKFTERGEVVVQAREFARRDRQVEVAFIIADTGIGMDGDTLSRLFQPFSQGDGSITRRFGGTGLGLTISRQLVEMMGGTIAVTSAPEEGTTFRFAIPFGVSALTAEARHAPAAPAYAGRRALVVDDNASARDIVERSLAHWGFAVDAVASGEEAVAAVRQGVALQRPYEVALIDWRMPGLDGVATARAIAADAGGAAAPAMILLTAYGRDDLMAEAGDANIAAFLAKPVSDSTLLDALAGVFRPAADRPLPGIGRAAVARSAAAGARILLVDDNDINRQVGEEALTAAGFVVDLAEDGRAAVDKALAAPVPYDAVLMDMQMPVMDGLEATRAIRQHFAAGRLPIIALTASALSEERERCLAAGMNDHVAKPIEPEALVATVARWVASRLPTGESVPVPVALAVETAAPAPAADTGTAARDLLPVTLPPFDITAALVRVNGKRAMLRRLILSFAAEFAGTAAELRRLLAEGRLQDAERAAHTLKSTAATLGAQDLSAAAATVERSLRAGETEAIGTMIERLETLLVAALTAAATLEAG